MRPDKQGQLPLQPAPGRYQPYPTGGGNRHNNRNSGGPGGPGHNTVRPTAHAAQASMHATSGCSHPDHAERALHPPAADLIGARTPAAAVASVTACLVNTKGADTISM